MSPPTSQEWQNMIYAYGACTLVIAVKYQVCQFIGVNPDNHPAEDEKLMGNKPEMSQEMMKRRNRQAANDVENIPWNMVVFWAAFGIQNLLNFSSTDGQNGTRALTALIIIYTLARCMYTVCYLMALQPFRSITFLIGVFSTLATAAVLMYDASQIDTSKWVA
jgi:glutathione S-transferase